MEEKKERLKALLDEYTKGNACLAFSGGIDSSLILKLAQEAADRNGTKLYAVTFDTVLHPKADREIASRVARENHSIHEIISVDELKQEEPLLSLQKIPVFLSPGFCQSPRCSRCHGRHQPG